MFAYKCSTQPRKLPAVVYTMRNGYQGVVPISQMDARVNLVNSYRQNPWVCRIEEANVEVPGWRTPNAMNLGTGNSAFERRACLITGNVVSDSMIGIFVRPRMEVSCNGMRFDRGKLQEHDLRPFHRANLHAGAMTQFINSESRFESELAHAYVIFHVARNKRVVHGALVTDQRNRLIRLFPRCELGLSRLASSDAVMEKACLYLTDACISERKVVWEVH